MREEEEEFSDLPMEEVVTAGGGGRTQKISFKKSPNPSLDGDSPRFNVGLMLGGARVFARN